MVRPCGHPSSSLLVADTGAPIEPSPLPPGYVDQVLVKWIAEGAQDN
jgi:hypothetical protein